MFRAITLLALSASAFATRLFVSDYSGSVTSLSLAVNSNNTYSLTNIARSGDCAPNPSWLTIDPSHGVLYCLNEGLATLNGSLSSFIINADGSLKHVLNVTTPNGPVSGVIYGNPAGPRGIALAHYGGSAVSSWTINDTAPGQFTANDNIPFTLAKTGPVASRQDAPHEHEAITDPTGQYVLVPDLGADLVRVFAWDPSSLKLKELSPLIAAPGSGPRHAAFYSPSGLTNSGRTYMYLVAELAGTVTAYEVAYLPNRGGLKFTPGAVQPTTGPFRPPQINAPAEVHLSPDNRFLVISNRNDSSFTLPARNGTLFPSDSLSTFALSPADGNLTFHQLWPAGGSFPRQYTMNAIGNLVAVGLQLSGEVVILERDVASGLIGAQVACVPIAGNVTSVVWDEERALGVLGG